MKIAAMLLCVGLMHMMTAMDPQPKPLQYLTANLKTWPKLLYGLVEESRTGKLECCVYDATDLIGGGYRGALYNNKYEPEKTWLNEPLEPEQAQYYYEQLHKLLLIKKMQ